MSVSNMYKVLLKDEL